MIDKTIAYIESNREAHTQQLCDLLRIQSVSTEPERKGDMTRAAEWVRDCLAAGGIEGTIVSTKGHPCVIADTGPVDGAGPTVLVYGHYDVQPVGDESLWDSAPFEPTQRDGAIFARGAADDKGQVLAHILAAVGWTKVAGHTPIRVKFLIEGEEEIGSPNLADLVKAHRERLACDYVVLSDTAKLDQDTPAITYGTKGLIYKEITVTGPKQDLHSGSFGGTVVNPANALSVILASMRDADNRVTIPGFYDDVRPLSVEERARLKALPFSDEQYITMVGAPGLDGEKGYTTLERRWGRPTLDVNGIISGFTGDGASTIIPAKAVAKVSMRVVPDQKPEAIARAFDAAVRAATPEGVRVEIADHAACGAYVCPTESRGMTAARQAVAKGFGKEPVLIREGGSLPILPMFKEVLGADSLMLGLCVPNCNAHGPNEFFGLNDFYAGIKSAAHLLHELADGA